jgi:hypothetical protein
MRSRAVRMRYHQDPESLTLREALALCRVEDIKPLVALVCGKVKARKEEMIDMLAAALQGAGAVRALYDNLDDLGQKAVQEATHDDKGALHRERFQARYGSLPDFGGTGTWRSEAPTKLRLFFPYADFLPTDLRATLETFVPEPPPLTVKKVDALPAMVRPPHVDIGSSYHKPNEEEVALRMRETARSALLDVKTVLRLVDAGDVRVGDKTRRASQASMKSIAAVLVDGDFYNDADLSQEEWSGASDLGMKPFAWPLLLQAAGLAQATGTKLQLTPAGRKALAQPAHEVTGSRRRCTTSSVGWIRSRGNRRKAH